MTAQFYHRQPTDAQLWLNFTGEIPIYTDTGIPIQIKSEGIWQRFHAQISELNHGCVAFSSINRRDLQIWEHSIKLRLQHINTIFLDRIVVSHSIRGQGIADVLMGEAMKVMDSLDYTIITNVAACDRETDFDRLVELFERHGFAMIYKNKERKGREFGAMYRQCRSQRNTG